MAISFKWESPEAIQSYLSTELNSLANSTGETTGKYLGAEIDNSSGLYAYMDLEMAIASITSGSGAPYIGAWILIALDGTNYETGSTSIDPAKMQEMAFQLKPSYTGAQTVALHGVVIPPYKFKLLLQNKAGAALASSGNTLKYRRHNEQGA